MRHTPGPWVIDGDCIESPNGDGTSKMIGSVLLGLSKGSFRVGSKAEQKANALTIKASPIMEAALAAILVMVQQGVDDRDLESIELYCRGALADAWGVESADVGTPDLEEFRPLLKVLQ